MTFFFAPVVLGNRKQKCLLFPDHHRICNISSFSLYSSLTERNVYVLFNKIVLQPVLVKSKRASSLVFLQVLAPVKVSREETGCLIRVRILVSSGVLGGL